MQLRRSTVRALGPRARNPLAWLAGIAGGLLVVAGVIHYATDVGNSSTKHRPQPPIAGTGNPSTRQQSLPLGEMNLGIAYGTTPKQVLREIGPPTKKHADCWLYRGHVGRIRGRYSGPYVDAMRFCFSEGPVGAKVMTQIFSHYATHTITKKHFPAQWGSPLTLLKVPDWYLQEKS